MDSYIDSFVGIIALVVVAYLLGFAIKSFTKED